MEYRVEIIKDVTIWGLYDSTRDAPDYFKSMEYYEKERRRVWAEMRPGRPFLGDDEQR